MAGVLIHEVSGYSGSAYNLKIPSLTDPANIQEAMMLFHYGYDSYDGSVEPEDASVFGNLRDFDTRIAALEDSQVVELSGTVNQIVSSGSVGFVTLSLPNELIAPGSLEVTTSGLFGSNLSTQGIFAVSSSASFGGNLDVNGNIDVSGSVEIDQNLVVGSGSANVLSVLGSSSFEESVVALKGVNVFEDSSERNSEITAPQEGTVVYLRTGNRYLVYDGSSWVSAIDSNFQTEVETRILEVETLALLGL